MLAEQHVTEHIQVDPNLFTPRADYLLRVRGMSMRDAGIIEGDLLAVHKTADARTGQVVVARLADEVTVKRLRRRGHAVQLMAELHGFLPRPRIQDGRVADGRNRRDLAVQRRDECPERLGQRNLSR
jgi:repressor LexA